MGSDDIFDILLLLFVIAILTPIMLQNTIPMFKGEMGGFGTLVEKSVQQTDSQTTEDNSPINNKDEEPITKEELSLMVVVADKLTPEPSIIQFAVDKNNDGVVTDSDDYSKDELSNEITLDDIISNKLSVLDTINRYISDGLDLKLYTQVGKNGIEKWVVCRK